MHIKSVPVAELEGCTVTGMSHGHPEFKHLGSYGAYTIRTTTGTYILWNAHGEVNLSKEVP